MNKNFVLATALTRKFPTELDLEKRLVALFKTKVCWLNEIATPEAEKAQRVHEGYLAGLEYHFNNEIRLLKSEYSDIMDALRVSDGFSVPAVGTALLNKEVSIETYCILDYLVGFSKNISGLVWRDESLRIEKYKAFFKPDMKRFAAIARPYFEAHK